MAAYAQGTAVPISRSKAEIEDLLTKRKAKNFAAGSHDGTGIIAFELQGRMIRIAFPMPNRDAAEFRTALRYGKEKELTAELADKLYDAACRQRRTESYAASAGVFYSEHIPSLVKIAERERVSPDDLRLVFYFDS
jgi:hypothetical protein